MNICILLIDCLRSDHLGCYGYHKNTSPNIDAIANKSVLFENAYAQANWTYPSLYSLITSRYPSAFNVTWVDQKINGDFTVMPEYLAARGYNTGLFTPFKMLLNPNAFCGHFNEVTGLPHYGDVLPAFRDWNKKNKNSFLLLHIPEYVHEPFCADKKYVSLFDEGGKKKTSHSSSEAVKCLTSQETTGNGLRSAIGKINTRLISLKKDDLSYLTACYDAGIYQVDKIVSNLYKIIRDEGKEYVFILAADHGQAFCEHGYFGHGLGIYEEVTKVPLIIDYNGSYNFRASELVQLMDIFPSFLDFLGFEKNFEMDGSSFFKIFHGERTLDRIAFSEGYPHICLRKGSHKLITAHSKYWGYKEIMCRFGHARNSFWKRNLLSLLLRFRGDKLYNLSTDSKEKVNVYQEEKETGAALKSQVSAIMERIRRGSRSPNDAKIDVEIEKQLRSLGYL